MGRVEDGKGTFLERRADDDAERAMGARKELRPAAHEREERPLLVVVVRVRMSRSRAEGEARQGEAQ